MGQPWQSHKTEPGESSEQAGNEEGPYPVSLIEEESLGLVQHLLVCLLLGHPLGEIGRVGVNLLHSVVCENSSSATAPSLLLG